MTIMRRTKSAITKDMKIILPMFVVLISIVLAIIIPACSYGQRQQEKRQQEIRYTPDKLAMLAMCPACHLEKQPPDECGEFTGWLWEECQDMVYRYPDGDRQ